MQPSGRHRSVELKRLWLMVAQPVEGRPHEQPVHPVQDACACRFVMGVGALRHQYDGFVPTAVVG